MTKYPGRWPGVRAVLSAIGAALREEDVPMLVRALVVLGDMLVRHWRS